MSDLLKNFEVWVELDEYNATEEDGNDEFCNAIVCFSDGLKIGVNVWSEKYFHSKVDHLDWIDQQIAVLPDIVVRDFKASSIRKAIAYLIDKDEWLYGRGFPSKSCE